MGAKVNAQMFTKKIKGDGTVITINRNVNEFDKIGIAGSFDVTLIKGNEGEISIKADENLMNYIITEIKDNTLKLRTKKGYQLKPSSTIKITVTFNSFDALSLAGSGNVNSNDILNSTNLKLSVAGSGNLNLQAKANNLSANIAGSGNINLNGFCSNFKTSIAGSGNLNAFDLKADVVKVSVTGSGNAKVNALKEISATTAGSGDIIYKGNPIIEKSKAVGSGNIKKKN